MRKLGDITSDLEVLLLEMVDDHEMQQGEILNLIRGYLEIHCPHAREVYADDDSSPVFYYGPREGLR